MTKKNSFEEQIKENIKKLINQNKLEESKDILNHYEKIGKYNDVELYSMKGIISMMEGNIEKAEKIFKQGLTINSQDFNLLYNLAYLYQFKENSELAIKYYKKAMRNAESEEDIKEVYKILEGLGVEEKEEEIVKEEFENDVNINKQSNGKLSILFLDGNLDRNMYSYILKWIKDFGFTLLKTLTVRGFSINGNNRENFIILYDLNPLEVEIEDDKKIDNIDNKRLSLINHLIYQIEIDFRIKGFNKYYLTRNEQEAKRILLENLDLNIKEIEDQVAKIESDYNTNYPVVHLFDGMRHRAKTELIEYRDGLAVKKTWKPGNEKYMKREKYAYDILGKKTDLVGNIIEIGKNYIITPYYEDSLYRNEQNKKVVLTNNVGKIAEFFEIMYKNNVYNPDIHPGQFVYSEKGGLKAIDFEYLQKYDEKPKSFLESYDIVGYPKDFKGEKPNYVGNGLHKMYNELWIKYTGYDLKQIAEIASIQYKGNDIEVDNVLGILNYAKTSGKSYSGSMYQNAYHSLYIKDYYFRGQREPAARLKNLKYCFKGKVVLDIGCNAGGMLHNLSEIIKNGLGIDYDYRLINSANLIKTVNKSDNLSFYKFNLEKEDLNLIKNYINTENRKVDICFLLSVCMWIENWKEVIEFTTTITENLLFETNGSDKQQRNQIKELKKNYSNVEIIEEKSIDDPGQHNRKLLFCTNVNNNKIVVNNKIGLRHGL